MPAMKADRPITATTLFSEQVLNRNINLDGDPVLRPPTWSAALSLTAIITTCLALFILFQGKYSARLAVTGYLSKASGVVEVSASGNGRLGQIYVAPQSTVKRGQPLFELLSPDQSTSAGQVLVQKLEGIKKQGLLLEQRHQAEIQSRNLEREKTDGQSRLLQEKLQFLMQREQLLRGQLDRRTLDERNLENLAGKGYLAERDMAEFREKSVLSRLSLLENQREIYVIHHQQEELRRTRLMQDAQWNAAELDSRVLQVQLEAQELDLQHSMARTVFAPFDGFVGDIHASTGALVSAMQPVISLVQRNDPVSAELAIPARMLPSVSGDLAVRITINDTLAPTRENLSGTIVDISATPLPAGWRMGPLTLSEPSFRALVTLDKADTTWMGHVQRGTHRIISAQLIGPPRTLIQWLLKPFRTLQQSVS
jgi:membrane fusion protein